MATNFMRLENSRKKTIFEYCLGVDLVIEDAQTQPQDWDNVLFIGEDTKYGDVFKCWNDGSQEGFYLFFGKIGNEFD